MSAPHFPQFGDYQVVHTPGEKYRCYLPPPLPPSPAVKLEPMMTLLERAVSKTRGAVSAAQRDHLGDARWRVGDHEGARREWTEAVRIAEAGMPREQNIEVLRRFFRQQLGLAAIDAARYHDAHDGSLAARAKAKLDASARGVEPPVARQSAVPAPNPPASAR